MTSLEQDIHDYNLALTEIQVELKSNIRVRDFREVLSEQVFITTSQSARSNPDSQIEKLRVVVLYSLNPSINSHY